jgi:uncharacterized protein (TIGR02646 family)
VIRVDRAGEPMPPDLADNGSAGARERQKTLDFYADSAHGQESFGGYASYKAKSVVEALGRLFRGKCAYCESRYAATQPVDVEHFRPKGGYVERDPATNKDRLVKPGYYWLAATWENLLPSCIDCNREREQEIFDQDPAKAGKANKFPLASGSRAAGPGGEANEVPLLLNPCEDDPDEHLEFQAEGVVSPALSGQGDSPRGSASIQVYGLQRTNLVQERRDRAILVRAQIERVRNLETLLDTAPDNPLLQSMLTQEMVALKDLQESRQPYAGMARQLVRALYRPGGG